jgi:hypothetical protein
LLFLLLARVAHLQRFFRPQPQPQSHRIASYHITSITTSNRNPLAHQYQTISSCRPHIHPPFPGDPEWSFDRFLRCSQLNDLLRHGHQLPVAAGHHHHRASAWLLRRDRCAQS